MMMKKLPTKLKAWIDARKRYCLSHGQIQMARELGLNPRKLDKLGDFRREESWKALLAARIEALYFRRYGKSEPENVTSIEDIALKLQEKQMRSSRNRRKETLPIPPGETGPEPSGPAGKVVRLAAPLSLRELVQELQFVSDDVMIYLNRFTGEFCTVTEEIRMMMDSGREDGPAWQREAVAMAREAEDSDNYIPLPTPFDIDEYGIMADFCASIEDEDLRADLGEAIRGKGAFRLFRNQVQARDLEKAWSEFENRAFAEIGRKWLEENGLSFKEDL